MDVPTEAILLLLVAAALYMLPSLVAACRHHHNEGAIVALNLLLGWTFVFWAIALVWSLTATERRAPRPRSRS